MQPASDSAVPFTLDEIRSEADEAWERIYPWLRQTVLRVIRPFRFDEERQDEIVSRAVSMVRKKATFDSPPGLKRFIAKTARGLALHAAKAAAKHQEFSTAEASLGSVWHLRAESAAGETEVEIEVIFERVVANLTESEKRLAILLKKYADAKHGHKIIPIAAELGISRGAADTRVCRLKKKMRALRRELM